MRLRAAARRGDEGFLERDVRESGTACLHLGHAVFASPSSAMVPALWPNDGARLSPKVSGPEWHPACVREGDTLGKTLPGH